MAAPSVSSEPFAFEEILGRRVKVETPLEIVAKKIRFRSDQFKARDLYDLALVMEREPGYVDEIERLLKEQKDLLLDRVERYKEILQEDFAEIDTLTYTPSFDHCLRLLMRHLR